jgi:hypothetical protein
MDFETNDEGCTCTIYRKDRAHPIRITEYMSECKRNVGPWQSHPKRMLRHKAMIQCARLAFGLVGAFDPDEAERIVDAPIELKTAPKAAKPVVKSIAEAKPVKSFEEFEKDQDAYRVTFGVYNGKTLDQIGEKTAKGYAQHLANDALKRGGDMKPEEGRFIQEVKAKYKSVTS